MKRAVEYLGFTSVLLLMAAAVLIYLAPHLGWRADAVLSGSMEPQLKVGSLLIARPVEPEAISVGDIIIFRPTSVGENLVSHRVIGIGHSSPLYFETKGDANYAPDPFTVPARNLVGRIWLHVPYVGYAAEFLKTPFGFVLGLVVPTLIIIAVYVRGIRRALSKDEKQNLDEVTSG